MCVGCGMWGVGLTAEWDGHANDAFSGPSLEVADALDECGVVGDAVEGLFDGWGDATVVVDLGL